MVPRDCRFCGIDTLVLVDVPLGIVWVRESVACRVSAPGLVPLGSALSELVSEVAGIVRTVFAVAVRVSVAVLTEGMPSDLSACKPAAVESFGISWRVPAAAALERVGFNGRNTASSLPPFSKRSDLTR